MTKTTLRRTLLMGAALLAAPVLAHAKPLHAVGVTMGSLGNPYFVALTKGITDAANAGGQQVRVTAVSADYDLNKQFNQIDNFIAAGVDMIVLNAVDANAILPAIKRAQAAGIVVVAADVSAGGGGGPRGHQQEPARPQGAGGGVGGGGGAGAGAGPRRHGGNRQRRRRQHVLRLPRAKARRQGPRGDRERAAGIGGDRPGEGLQGGAGELAGDQDPVLGPGRQGLARRRAVGDAGLPDPLPRPERAVRDPQAIGSELAAKQQHRDNIVITSVDGAPDIVSALKSNGLIVASASQDPYGMGQLAVKVGKEIMDGHPPAQKVTLMQAKLVTRDNVNSYVGWTNH